MPSQIQNLFWKWDLNPSKRPNWCQLDQGVRKIHLQTLLLRALPDTGNPSPISRVLRDTHGIIGKRSNCLLLFLEISPAVSNSRRRFHHSPGLFWYNYDIDSSFADPLDLLAGCSWLPQFTAQGAPLVSFATFPNFKINYNLEISSLLKHTQIKN